MGSQLPLLAAPSVLAGHDVAPGNCPTCDVALAPVVGGGGAAIAWQCPRCLAAYRSRMPPEPRGLGACPVCCEEFYELGVHFGKSECRRWYHEGMLADAKARPPWAPFAEVPRG